MSWYMYMALFQPFNPLNRIDLPTVISRTRPFPILGVLVGIFLFILNFNSEQWRLWSDSDLCLTVCLCPTKRTTRGGGGGGGTGYENVKMPTLITIVGILTFMSMIKIYSVELSTKQVL